MRVRFWGTRGSIAKPGEGTVRYGGNTSCVEIRSDGGTLLILDCGTGAHGLGEALLTEESEPRDGHILVTHTHWDHIQGFPFFRPLFNPHDHWRVLGPGRRSGPSVPDVLGRKVPDNAALRQRMRETFSGQMQFDYFPVSIDQLKANVDYRDLDKPGTFEIGDIRITTQYLNHTSVTLGYRLEADGVIVVYATDHEPHERHLAHGGKTPRGGEDENHMRFCEDADLLIHDTQYTSAEYSAKEGWGHSTMEYAVDRALEAGVQLLALYHHDPLRDDDALDRQLADARERVQISGGALQVIAATEGESMTLLARDKTRVSPDTGPAVVLSDSSHAPHTGPVLIAIDGVEAQDLIEGAAAADGLTGERADGEVALRRIVTESMPSVVALSRRVGGTDALDVCRHLRALPGCEDLPIAVVAQAHEVDREAGREAGVTDWLVLPCSPQFARARLQTWVLRSAGRWQRAVRSDDEERRLQAVTALGLLDTDPEERFDRHTRIAAALFEVPVALVSLIDRDRQWFKSRVGLDIRQTHRDLSFCAHAISGQGLLLVEDASEDERFADNPLVTDKHIRFYAGVPLTVNGGMQVGTLCLMDHVPRHLTPRERVLLHDLADLVQRELGL